MKKVFLGIITLLWSNSVLSQQCNFDKNEVDKFTKRTVMLTEPYQIWRDKWSGSNMTVQGHKVDSTSWVRFRYSSPSVFAIREDSNLILLFKDGSTITLVSAESVIAESIHAGSLTRWYAFVPYLLTEEAKNDILSKELTDVRLYTSDGYIDKEVKGKDVNSFKNAVRCIQ